MSEEKGRVCMGVGTRQETHAHIVCVERESKRRKRTENHMSKLHKVKGGSEREGITQLKEREGIDV